MLHLVASVTGLFTIGNLRAARMGYALGTVRLMCSYLTLLVRTFMYWSKSKSKSRDAIRYVRVLPAGSRRKSGITYGLGLLAALAGFMLAAYIVAYTIARINGWCLG